MNISSIKIMGCTDSKAIREEEERKREKEKRIENLKYWLDKYSIDVRTLRAENSRLNCLLIHKVYVSFENGLRFSSNSGKYPTREGRIDIIAVKKIIAKKELAIKKILRDINILFNELSSLDETSEYPIVTNGLYYFEEEGFNPSDLMEVDKTFFNPWL